MLGIYIKKTVGTISTNDPEHIEYLLRPFCSTHMSLTMSEKRMGYYSLISAARAQRTTDTKRHPQVHRHATADCPTALGTTIPTEPQYTYSLYD